MNDPAPGRELVRAADPLLGREEHNNLARMANTLAASSVFSDVKSGSDAYAKILLGRSIGLGPMQAMTGIHLIDGKPQIAATTLAAFVRESARYDYRVLLHTADRCVIEFGEVSAAGAGAPGKLAPADRPDLTVDPEDDPLAAVLADWEPWPDSLGISDFSIEEAQKAGLGKWPDEKAWDKSQWGKWPRNMVFARAMSNGVKWYAPDLFGGVPIYTEADEIVADRVALTAGEGDGQPVGLELPAEVEAVIARAQQVGHASLSNRGAVEVAIGGVEDERDVAAWVARATAELDGAEAAHAPPSGDVEVDGGEVDADVLPADDDAAGWRQRSAEKLESWENVRALERKRGALEDDGTKRLKSEADTALQTAMNIEEGGGVQAEVRRVGDPPLDPDLDRLAARKGREATEAAREAVEGGENDVS